MPQKFEDVEIDGQSFDQFIDERIQKAIGTPIEEQIRESTEQMRKDHFEFLAKTEKEKRETLEVSQRKARRAKLMQPGWNDEKRAMFTGLKAMSFLVLCHKAFVNGQKPADMAPVAEKAGLPRVAKALSVSVSDAGGILINPEFSDDFIGGIYKTMALMKLGARNIQMPRGAKLDLGELTQSAVFSWLGELENAVVSQQAFGKKSMEPKRGAAMVPVSNQFLRREFQGIEQILVDDMLMVTAVGVETGFWRGDGTGNNPLGIANQMDAGQTVASSGNTLALIEDDYIDMQFRVLANLNGNEAKSPGFVSTLGEKQHLMKLRTTDGYPVYRDELNRNMFMGVPFEVCGCLPDTLGAGSNETESYFGDFAEVLVGTTMEATYDSSKTASYTTGGQTYHTFQDDSTLMRVQIEKDILLRRNKALARTSGINRSA